MKNTETQQLAPQGGEVVLYNPDDTIRLEVRMNDETVWLSQEHLVPCARDAVEMFCVTVLIVDTVI